MQFNYKIIFAHAFGSYCQQVSTLSPLTQKIISTWSCMASYTATDCIVEAKCYFSATCNNCSHFIRYIFTTCSFFFFPVAPCNSKSKLLIKACIRIKCPPKMCYINIEVFEGFEEKMCKRLWNGSFTLKSNLSWKSIPFCSEIIFLWYVPHWAFLLLIWFVASNQIGNFQKRHYPIHLSSRYKTYCDA